MSEVVSSDDIWADDKLRRKEDAQHIINFLEARVKARQAKKQTGTYVLNIDAEWGYGKTFFLERLQKQLQAQGNLVAFINAWQDDHTPDPFVAVLAAIDEVVDPYIDKKHARAQDAYKSVKSTAKTVAVKAGSAFLKQVVRRYFGEEIEDLLSENNIELNSKDITDALSTGVDAVLDEYAEKLLSDFKDSKNSIQTFKNNFKKFLEVVSGYKNVELPFYILIDELDRCRPTYAIELLERVKHLFDIDNVVFIIATDSTQLCHSIKAVYGEGFESHKYLHRFFDRVYKFQKPVIVDFVKLLFHENPLKSDNLRISPDPEETLQGFFIKCVEYFGLKIRDVEQCFDHLETIISMWPSNMHNVKIELSYLLPLIFAYHHDENYFKILSSKASTQKAVEEQYSQEIKINFCEDNPNPRSRNTPIPKKITMNKFIHEVSQLAFSNVPSTNYSRDSELGDFLHSIHQEQKTQKKQNDPTESKYSSHLQKYPDLVKTAGKFKNPHLVTE